MRASPIVSSFVEMTFSMTAYVKCANEYFQQNPRCPPAGSHSMK